MKLEESSRAPATIRQDASTIIGISDRRIARHREIVAGQLKGASRPATAEPLNKQTSPSLKADEPSKFGETVKVRAAPHCL
jgi:hypothetical protein